MANSLDLLAQEEPLHRVLRTLLCPRRRPPPPRPPQLTCEAAGEHPFPGSRSIVEAEPVAPRIAPPPGNTRVSDSRSLKNTERHNDLKDLTDININRRTRKTTVDSSENRRLWNV